VQQLLETLLVFWTKLVQLLVGPLLFGLSRIGLAPFVAGSSAGVFVG
jgi:hypothetical protein